MHDYLDDKKIKELKKMDDLARANMLSLMMFKDKYDKAGDIYIRHLNRVSTFMSDKDGKCAALLHDLIEDTAFTLNDLKKLNFNDVVIDTVRLLTNDLGDYDLFIKRIIASDNILAIKIKIADLLDNMNINRFNNPSLKDFQRIKNKYLKSYKLLIEELERRTIK